MSHEALERKSKEISAQVANRMENLKKKVEELEEQIKEEQHIVKMASAMGDYSENAERQSALDSLAMLTVSRISYMNTLEAYENYESAYKHNGTVMLGSTVRVTDCKLNTELYVKIYPDTLGNVRIGALAESTPLGAAMKGKKAGDLVTAKSLQYRIEEVL